MTTSTAHARHRPTGTPRWYVWGEEDGDGSYRLYEPLPAARLRRRRILATAITLATSVAVAAALAVYVNVAVASVAVVAVCAVVVVRSGDSAWGRRHVATAWDQDMGLLDVVRRKLPDDLPAFHQAVWDVKVAQRRAPALARGGGVPPAVRDAQGRLDVLRQQVRQRASALATSQVDEIMGAR